MRSIEKAYYDKRAPEYDDWWLGTGLFSTRDRPGWGQEVEQLVRLVGSLEPRRTLEVACGTGFLSRHLRGALTALDQSQAMLDLARERLPGAQLVCADVPPLPFADGEFERVFTSHFYGHLDPGLRSQFVTEARRVAGELVIVDSGGGDRDQVQERVLSDGSRHEVYKRWFSGATLADEIGGDVLIDGAWFVAVRAQDARSIARPR